MKRFLLALALLVFAYSHSAFSADGSITSPFDLGVVNGSTSFSGSGVIVGQTPRYYSFGIYTTATAGATVDISYSSPQGDPMELLALYSGTTKILAGALASTDGTNFTCTVTLTGNLSPGEYLLEVSAAGSVSGTAAPDFTMNLNLGNYATPVSLASPVNLSPANGAIDCAASNLQLEATPYSWNNSSGSTASTEWLVRRTTDNAVVLNATVAGGANWVYITSLKAGRKYSWQVRYANTVNQWTPYSAATVFTVATVWPPQLSASTVNAVAVESPFHQGTIRIYRTTTSGTKTVTLKAGGTAVPGVDYQPIATSVTIPNGSHYVDVPIVPARAPTFSGKRSVTVTVHPTSGFTLTAPTAAIAIRSTLLPEHLVVCEALKEAVGADPTPRGIYSFQYANTTGTGGAPENEILFGNGTEQPLYGDFTGSGVDTLLLKSGATYSLALGDSGTVSGATFHFGPAGSTAFIADYTGVGRDNLIVRHGNVFYVRRHMADGAAPSSFSFTFGNPGDELVLRSDRVRTGDWDGDGHDDIFLRRGNLFLVRLSRTGTIVQFYFGDAASEVFLADLNGDGKVEPVLWDHKNLYTADIHHNQTSPLTLRYGRDGELATAVDLNADKLDELVLRRGTRFLIDYGHNGGAAERTIVDNFGQAKDKLLLMRQ